MSSNFDGTIGLELAATWVNSLLFMLEITKAWDYFSRYPNDQRLVKGMVIACLLADATATISGYSLVYFNVYQTTVTTPLHASVQHTLATIADTLSSDIVRCFLILRYWRLSRNKFVAAFLLFTVLCTTGGLISLAIAFKQTETVSHLQNRSVVANFLMAAISSIICDLGIAVALIWELRGNSERAAKRSTVNMVKKVTRYAIVNGLVDSSIAVLLLVSFFAFASSRALTAVLIFGARIYTLTMLANLLTRTSERDAGRPNTTLGDFSPGALALAGLGSPGRSPQRSDQLSPMVFVHTSRVTDSAGHPEGRSAWFSDTGSTGSNQREKKPHTLV